MRKRKSLIGSFIHYEYHNNEYHVLEILEIHNKVVLCRIWDEIDHSLGKFSVHQSDDMAVYDIEILFSKEVYLDIKRLANECISDNTTTHKHNPKFSPFKVKMGMAIKAAEKDYSKLRDVS